MAIREHPAPKGEGLDEMTIGVGGRTGASAIPATAVQDVRA